MEGNHWEGEEGFRAQVVGAAVARNVVGGLGEREYVFLGKNAVKVGNESVLENVKSLVWRMEK